MDFKAIKGSTPFARSVIRNPRGLPGLCFLVSTLSSRRGMRHLNKVYMTHSATSTTKPTKFSKFHVKQSSLFTFFE